MFGASVRSLGCFVCWMCGTCCSPVSAQAVNAEQIKCNITHKQDIKVNEERSKRSQPEFQSKTAPAKASRKSAILHARISTLHSVVSETVYTTTQDTSSE